MTPQRRVQITFFALVLLSTIAFGAIGRVVTWAASPVAGIALALFGIVAVGAVALALRVLLVTSDGDRTDPRMCPSDTGAVTIGTLRAGGALSVTHRCGDSARTRVDSADVLRPAPSDDGKCQAEWSGG